MTLYSRALIKVSGEALLGEREYGVSPETCKRIAAEIVKAKDAGTQIAVVIGGGNIFRGLAGSTNGMDRATADYIGMLATVMNGLALQDALETLGQDTRVMTSLAMPDVAEPYIRRRAVRHLEKGRIIILVAGIGAPYFTTDTGAAQRALDINCDILVKATQVDGVYASDPKLDPTAERYDKITYADVLNKHLKIMDVAALTLCRDNNLPLMVCKLSEADSIREALLGTGKFTFISNEVE